MIIEIEYYKGNTLLFGKTRNPVELKKQLDNIQVIYDHDIDRLIKVKY